MNHPDEPVEPDHFTETALRLLPIPDHGETFWEDLDRALGGVAAPSSATPDGSSSPDRTDRLVRASRAPAEPVVDDALALVPPALRQRSNAMVVAVAAAAVVVVMLAGTSLVRGSGGDDQVEVADAPLSGSSGTLDSPVDDAPPALVTLSASHEEASTDAVAAWVDAVHTGDVDAAWDAMGPGSQEHFGTEEAFETQLAAMDDQFGDWASAEPDDVLITPVLDGEDGTVAVVTLVGTTEGEGETGRRAEAFPVRIIDGAVVLEPFADAGVLELAVPAPVDGAPPVAEAGEELVVVVPAGVDAPILRLDDGDSVVCGESDDTELADMDDLPTQRCSYLPKDGLAAGDHTLTVAFTGPEGASISAEALVFQAA